MSGRPSLSSALGGLVRNLLQTAFRLFPWPTEPGLRRVGEANELSPVIVTCNYDLTVRRVLRALRGLDAWLVVAPSRGINVWCASSGGHLTTHQVVTALKTSGVEERVQHRRALLPQLAATGVLAREVNRRCGWRTRFGPVYAEDIPRYLANEGEKTDDMLRVHFGPVERFEMACAWAVPIAILAGLLAAWLEPGWVLPLVAQVALLTLAVFFVYDRIPGPRSWILGGAAMAASVAAVAHAGGGGAALVGAAGASALLTALLTFDYSGSTPTEGGSHFAERRWQIRLDLERCKGLYSCWEVCPRACFEKRPDARKVEHAHDERCVHCGACVVQCSLDALAFEDEEGRRVEPGIIRRFKLNLSGQRAVDAGELPRPDADDRDASA
jgi:NAD-dependent dihydropyrimidine dehydrogenase PreA subunit